MDTNEEYGKRGQAVQKTPENGGTSNSAMSEPSDRFAVLATGAHRLSRNGRVPSAAGTVAYGAVKDARHAAVLRVDRSSDAVRGGVPRFPNSSEFHFGGATRFFAESMWVLRRRFTHLSMEGFVMKMPNGDASSERLLDYFGLYLESRLSGDVTAGAIVTIITAAQHSLNEANLKQRAAYRTLQITRATRDRAEFALDRVLGDVHRSVLTAANGDNTSNLYRSFLPKGLTGITRAPIIDKIQDVIRVEATLARSPAGFSVLVHAKHLGAARMEFEKTVVAWNAANAAHDDLQIAEVTERVRWRKSYRTVFGELTRLYADDRMTVESYFRRTANGRTKTEGEVKEAA